MPLGEIVNTALKLTLRRRDLWFFGFLIALLGSPLLMNTFATPPLSGNYLQTTPPQALNASGWQPPAVWRQIMSSVSPHEALLIATSLTGIMIVMLIVFYAFAVVGKAAVLRSLVADLHGEALRGRRLLKETRRFFWRMFAYPWPAVLLFGIGVGGLGIFMGALAMQAGAVGGVLLLIPFLIATVVVAWLTFTYFHLGDGAVVIEDLPYWDAISRPWSLWKAHFWPVLLVALVLSVGQWVIDALLSYAATALMFLATLLFRANLTALVPWLIAHPGMLITLASLFMLIGKIMLAVILAPVMVFITVSWGLTYLALLKRWPLPHPDHPAAATPAASRPHA